MTLKLLFLGRSLLTVREKPAPYKMAQEILPKFAPRDLVWRSAAHPSGGGAGAADLAVSVSFAPSQTPVTPGHAGSVSGGPVGQGVSRGGGSDAPPARSSRQWMGLLESALAPKGCASRRDLSARRRRLESDSGQQRELSLDAVQVVRNDLVDADLAIVASRERPEAARRILPASVHGEAAPSSTWRWSSIWYHTMDPVI